MVVSVLGFGGSEIGYQRASGRTVARLLGGALDAGLNVIDTAECYERSEELIGRAVGGRRNDFFLFTKCGHAGSFGNADWRPAALLKSSCGRATSSPRSSARGSVAGRVSSAIAGTAKLPATRSNAGASTRCRPP